MGLFDLFKKKEASITSEDPNSQLTEYLLLKKHIENNGSLMDLSKINKLIYEKMHFGALSSFQKKIHDRAFGRLRDNFPKFE